MLTHIELLSTDEVVLGLDGSILQISTGAGKGFCSIDCDHQLGPAEELGSKVGGRTTSTILGGGGRRGRNRFMMLVLTSSLFPHNSSPAPSSSNPSSADAWVL